MTQDVDTQALADAASGYEHARDAVGALLTRLTSALDADWGCAGTDTAGQAWASGYDPAAADAVGLGMDVANAFAKLHDLLAYTGANHANAENASMVPRGPHLPAPATLAPYTAAPAFRGAYGGDTDAPLGWGAVSRWLQGRLWPNGNPGKLRGLGRAWSTAATTLRSTDDGLGLAWELVEDLQSMELGKALAQMDLVGGTAEDLAAEFERLGKACHEWAEEIDQAHQRIRQIIHEVLGWAILAGLIGAVAGSVIGPEGTVGGGTAAAAASARQAAMRVLPILIRLDAAAAARAGAIGVGAVGSGVLGRKLTPILQANPFAYQVNSGGAGPGSGADHQGHYKPAPRDLPGFPRAERVPPRTGRKRWRDPDDGTILEWDYRHGAVEKYNGKTGKHLGEYDPSTGVQTKPPNPGRKIGR